MHAMTRWAGGGVVLVSGMILAGCSAPEVPGPAPTPSVVWSAGEPSGPLESDPWVQAVRAGALPQAVALNSRDLRSPSLHAALTSTAVRDVYGILHEYARDNSTDDDGARRAPGPRPFDPLSVDVAPDGKSATVKGCTVFDWLITQDDGVFDDGAEPVQGWYDVVLSSSGGYRVDHFTITGGACESQNLTIGTFDPLPDGNWDYWQEDILKGGFAEDPSEVP